LWQKRKKKRGGGGSRWEKGGKCLLGDHVFSNPPAFEKKTRGGRGNVGSGGKKPREEKGGLGEKSSCRKEKARTSRGRPPFQHQTKWSDPRLQKEGCKKKIGEVDGWPKGGFAR